jgi:hypothetical protein
MNLGMVLQVCVWLLLVFYAFGLVCMAMLPTTDLTKLYVKAAAKLQEGTAATRLAWIVRAAGFSYAAWRLWS